MAFFIYNYSENAEYDAGIKHSLLSVPFMMHVLFSVVRTRRLHNVCVRHSVNCDRCSTTQ